MSQPSEKPPRKWWAKVLIAVAALLVAGLVLVMGSCVALFVWRGREARRDAADNQQRAAPLIEALRRYQYLRGACPNEIEQAAPEFIRQIPEVRHGERFRAFYYRCARDGKRFWVAFDDVSGAFLPSDLVYEYDSETRDWTLMDISAAKFMQKE